jgi:hypothetical protein
MSDFSHLSINDKILIHVKSMLKTLRKQDIQTLKETNYQEYYEGLQTKYKDLSFKYPSLFTMLLEKGDDFDLDKLKKYLQLNQKVINNEVKEYDASVQIGTEEYNKYVKPLVETLDK